MSTPSSMVGEQNRAASRPARNACSRLIRSSAATCPVCSAESSPASVGARSAVEPREVRVRASLRSARAGADARTWCAPDRAPAPGRRRAASARRSPSAARPRPRRAARPRSAGGPATPRRPRARGPRPPRHGDRRRSPRCAWSAGSVRCSTACRGAARRSGRGRPRWRRAAARPCPGAAARPGRRSTARTGPGRRGGLSERVRSSESVGASSTSTPRRWSAIARNTVSRRSGVAPAMAGAPAHSVSSAASSARPW